LSIRDEAWTPTGPQKIVQAGAATSNKHHLLEIIERYNVTPAEIETLLSEIGYPKKSP
jgi:hypothetical protein